MRYLTFRTISTLLLIFMLVVIIFFAGNYVCNHDVKTAGTADVTANIQKVLTIGRDNVTYASGTPDYTCDGVKDHVQVQAALDTLPPAGGRIWLLAGNYSFSATASRNIDNVVIEGSGLITHISNNDSTPLFDPGSQDGWVFKDLETDAGGITVSAATGCIFQNVNLGSTHYAFWTSSGITGDEFEVPAVRKLTYIVAASDAPENEKARADYICDGTDDDVEIQAAIGSGRRVILTEGNFLGGNLNITYDNLTIEGQGRSTIYKLADNEDSNGFECLGSSQGDIVSLIIKNLTIDMNKANQKFSSETQGNAIYLKYVDNFEVSGVHIREAKAHAIALRTARYGSVHDNFLLKCEESHGIDCDNVANDYTSYVKIHGNTVVDQGLCGIKTEHSHDISIYDNNVIQTQVMTGSNKGDGIQIAQDSTSEAVFLYNVSAHGNIIIGAHIGIIITNLDVNNGNISVTGNSIDSTTDNGIGIETVTIPVTVSGNSIEDAAVYGVHISLSSYTKLTLNNIASAKQGIVLGSSSDCYISGNSILKNGYQAFGLRGACLRDVFSNNIIYGGDDTISGFWDPKGWIAILPVLVVFVIGLAVLVRVSLAHLLRKI